MMFKKNDQLRKINWKGKVKSIKTLIEYYAEKSEIDFRKYELVWILNQQKDVRTESEEHQSYTDVECSD